jgi:hypothetical protein
MKRVPLYRWIIDSETRPGRRVKTRHAMTEELALSRGGNPVRIDPPVQWIDVAETDEERAAHLTPGVGVQQYPG